MWSVFLVCFAVSTNGLCIGAGGAEQQCAVPYCESRQTEAEARELGAAHKPAQLYKFGLGKKPEAKFLEILK